MSEPLVSQQASAETTDQRIVRLIFLDDANFWLEKCTQALAKYGVTLEVVYLEATWAVGNLSVYGVSDKVLDKVREMTESGMADAIIVGNNRGAGVAKAATISAALREKTLIVWNRYQSGDEQPYKALGFEHFGERGGMSEWLVRTFAS